MINPLLYFHSVRFLKPQQIYFRLYYTLRRNARKAVRHRYDYSVPRAGNHLRLAAPIAAKEVYSANRFMFLNLEKEFRTIDWDFPEFGKLWCYNLNYFAFLMQDSMTPEDGLAMIHDFIKKINKNKTGLEAYPMSLRIVNWIKFLSKYMIADETIDHSLYAQAMILDDNIEYHLMGNHLMENAAALLFAGYYFREEYFIRKAEGLLLQELNEQLLRDGGHFELSPMYHAVLLERILDCINLIAHNKIINSSDIESKLREKASVMSGWLKHITFMNGDIPLVNDSVNGVAAAPAELYEYADRLGIKEAIYPLKESGYRMVRYSNYEMLMDVGNIGPDYLPGHAHSDTLGFVLYMHNKPFIVDTGVSTYERNELRLSQRGTSAHNTVKVGNYEQSEVWGSFRVGNRAYVYDLSENENMITAKHDGYKRIGAVHERRFQFSEKGVVLTDRITMKKKYPGYAFLHFHPEIKIQRKGDSIIADNALVRFSGQKNIDIENYYYAPGFNKLVPAQMAKIEFNEILRTEITV